MKKTLVAAFLLALTLTVPSFAANEQQMRDEMIAPVVRVTVKAPDHSETGAGTVVRSVKDDDGNVVTFILTNTHVVADMVPDHSNPDASPEAKLSVQQFVYDDNGVLISTVDKPAMLVAASKKYDIAVLALADRTNILPTANIKAPDEKVNVFDPVIAVGSGLGQAPFPTEGVISNTDIEMSGQRFYQESAPIIMGNSGGALFRFNSETKHYELIGIPARVAQYPVSDDTAVAATHMGFAIPIDEVRALFAKQGLDILGNPDTAEAPVIR